MSIRTKSGTSLSKGYFKAKKRFDWISKLYHHTRKKLNRLADIVAIHPTTFGMDSNIIALYWTGDDEHLKRIVKVLGVEFRDGAINISSEPVKFGRISAKVMLVRQATAVHEMLTRAAAKRRKRKAA